MTFCEVTFRYQHRLTEKQLTALEALRGQLYGLHRFHVDDSQNLIRVEYDASRVTVKDVEAALRGAGVAVVEQVVAA